MLKLKVIVNVDSATIVRKKCTVGHKCKSPPQLLLFNDEADSEPILLESFLTNDILAKQLQCLEVQKHSAISYHALASGNSSSTLGFFGHVNGSLIQVLMDER